MRRDKSALLSGCGIEEIVCVLLIGFFAMQGAIPGISPNQAAEMTNTPPTGLMKTVGIGSQVLVDGVICLLVCANFRHLTKLAFGLRWTAPVAFVAVCSTLWSQDPATTARRSLPFFLATIFGLYLASRFSVEQQVSIVCKTMLLAALVSAALAFFLPAIGLDASTGHQHDWQGIFTQKNACGRAMVFASASLLSYRRITVQRFFILGIFIFVLMMSGSRGAWLAEAVLLLCHIVLRVMERFSVSSRKALLYAFLLVSLSGFAALWRYFPLLASLFGRDATLTGRTDIWRQVWLAIMKHPFTGYGFSAFWQGMKGESYQVILSLRFVIFHAHNGFLEIWLELGAIGLFLFLAGYLNAWRKLWPLMRSRRLPEATWMIFILVLVVVYDMDENSLLTFNGLFWILYVSVVADIEILSREHRLFQQIKKQYVSDNSRLVFTA